MSKRYSPVELEKILYHFHQLTPLTELASILNRSTLGLVKKMQECHEQAPEKWPLEILKEYKAQRQKLFMQKYRDTMNKSHRKHVQEHKEQEKEYQRHYRERTKGKWKRFGDYFTKLLQGYKDGNGKARFEQEIALKLGLHPSMLSHIKAGSRKPTEETLYKMSKLFKVPYTKLEEKIKNN